MSKKMLRILFCGDVMPGGVLPYQNQYISPDLHAYMQGFDLRIGTLECAIGTNLSPAPEKLKENGGNNNVCFARDEDFFRVKELGFNVMSLGNNHSFDLGEEGLRNTIRHLQDNNISYMGAGMNKQEAAEPCVIEHCGVTICIIACCISGLSPKSLIVATEKTYGVYQPTIEELVSQIKSYYGKYDKIIVMPHWGEEHVFLPPYKCVLYSRKMINAGADAVIGSHSHVLSSNITYKRKPIYFGLGNYLNPDKCLTPPRPFFYPDSADELKSMPRCINYPRSVRQKTILVSSEDARIGMGLEVDLTKEKIKTRRFLVHNGNDNVLRFYKKDSSIKNFLLDTILIPILNLNTQPWLYRFTQPFLWRISISRLNKLGDFRKDV
jgi:poly-gamma-glutamate synthesis protein (capsule biosynthesis protein)